MRYLCFNLLQQLGSFQDWFVAHFTRLVISLFCSVVAFATFLEPTYMLILVCFFAIMADCYTAWRLAVRLRRKYPLHPNVGKFQSKKSKKIVDSMIQVLIAVILAYLLDEVIIIGANLYLQYYTAGAIGIYNFVSVLENISSESDANWAKFLQRFLINKAERHTGIPLDELKKKVESNFSDQFLQPVVGSTDTLRNKSKEEFEREYTGSVDKASQSAGISNSFKRGYVDPITGLRDNTGSDLVRGIIQTPDIHYYDPNIKTPYHDGSTGMNKGESMDLHGKASPIVTLPAEAPIPVSNDAVAYKRKDE